MAERVLEREGPIGDPTSAIAAEVAFARAARVEGQWTAFREYAAPASQIHWSGNMAEADEWLRGRADPPQSNRWAARQAWSSCDGSTVLVIGTSTDPAGNWSRFSRIWERQDDGDFLWKYSLSLPDPELTRSRQERERQRDEEAQAGNAILVEADDFIRATVVDCTTTPTLVPPNTPPVGTLLTGGGASQDNTLRWIWRTMRDAPNSFGVYAWNGEGWDVIHSEIFDTDLTAR